MMMMMMMMMIGINRSILNPCDIPLFFYLLQAHLMVSGSGCLSAGELMGDASWGIFFE